MAPAAPEPSRELFIRSKGRCLWAVRPSPWQSDRPSDRMCDGLSEAAAVDPASLNHSSWARSLLDAQGFVQGRQVRRASYPCTTAASSWRSVIRTSIRVLSSSASATDRSTGTSSSEETSTGHELFQTACLTGDYGPHPSGTRASSRGVTWTDGRRCWGGGALGTPRLSVSVSAISTAGVTRRGLYSRAGNRGSARRSVAARPELPCGWRPA
jgi:hypothetical protein